LKRVFISRDSSDVQALKMFCEEHQISLIAKSLLSFSAAQSPVIPDTDVIFFSSIRAAQFFLEVFQGDLRSKQLACIGQKTAEAILEKCNLKMDFIGSRAAEPKQVAIEFAVWLAGRKVLVPHSNLSQKTIVANLPIEQVETVEVYKTLLIPTTIEPCDSYIFSSPSNVDAFFLKNTLAAKQHIIAWGETTAKSLHEKGIQPIILKGNPDIESIKKEVLKQINTPSI